MYSIDLPSCAPLPLTCSSLVLPLAGSSVHAGFPSPAEDFLDRRIDLSTALITHPQATFFQRVAGDSMREFGIYDRDLLIVNRALRRHHGDIVIAVVDGEFTVKQLYEKFGIIKLKAGNPTYPDIIPKDGQTIEIWGVVTHSIKNFRQQS